MTFFFFKVFLCFFPLLDVFSVTCVSPKPTCWLLSTVALQWTVSFQQLSLRRRKGLSLRSCQERNAWNHTVFCWFHPSVCVLSEFYPDLKVELCPIQEVCKELGSRSSDAVEQTGASRRGVDSAPDAGDLNQGRTGQMGSCALKFRTHWQIPMLFLLVELLSFLILSPRAFYSGALEEFPEKTLGILVAAPVRTAAWDFLTLQSLPLSSNIKCS